MPVLTRAVARSFLTVVRRCTSATRRPIPDVFCRGGPDGLSLSARPGDVAVLYHDPAPQAASAIAFPGTALALFEGASDVAVTLSAPHRGQGIAHWTDADGSRTETFLTLPPDQAPSDPAPPPVPALQPDLLTSLAQASSCTAREDTRYCMTRVLLRGRTGEVVGTDSKQLFIYGGLRITWTEDVLIPSLPIWARSCTAREDTRYCMTRVLLRGRTGEVVGTDSKQLFIYGGLRITWTEDVLIPSLPIWALRELTRHEPAGLSRRDNQVVVRAGPWSLALPIDSAGRFPAYEQIVPKMGPGGSQVRIDPADAAFALAALRRLPGHDDDPATVTLDLGPAVILRAAQDVRVAEVVLSRSQTAGPAVRIACDRQHLARALRLGFTEIFISRPDISCPLLARDRQRRYLFMPFGKESVALPHPEAVRTVSAGATDRVSRPTQPLPPVRSSPMPPTSTNGHPHSPEPNGEPAVPGSNLPNLIVIAEQIRGSLLDAASWVGQLTSAQRRQRQQGRAMEQAMQSLRKLRALGS